MRDSHLTCSARVEPENRVNEVQGAKHVSSWERTTSHKQEEESLQGYFTLWVFLVTRTLSKTYSSACVRVCLRTDRELWPVLRRMVNGCKKKDARARIHFEAHTATSLFGVTDSTLTLFDCTAGWWWGKLFCQVNLPHLYTHRLYFGKASISLAKEVVVCLAMTMHKRANALTAHDHVDQCMKWNQIFKNLFGRFLWESSNFSHA